MRPSAMTRRKTPVVADTRRESKPVTGSARSRAEAQLGGVLTGAATPSATDQRRSLEAAVRRGRPAVLDAQIDAMGLDLETDAPREIGHRGRSARLGLTG